VKILITGANGRIGKQLAASLAAKHNLVLLTHRSPTVSSAAKTYSIDLSDPVGLERIFADERPEVVIHLAAMLGSACEEDPELAQKINVDATIDLAKIASKYAVKKLIFASTAAVYHQTELSPTDEASNVNPQSVYGKTKLEAEQALIKALKGSGVALSILRIFNVYGPGFDSSLVYKLAHSTPEHPVILHGLKNYHRDYVHITDVIEAFETLIRQKGENPGTLNIGSGRVFSNGELIAELQGKGFSPQYRVVGSGTNVSWANIDKARHTIGFNPKTNLVLD
jgi:UDP-glucose 4-epimerase